MKYKTLRANPGARPHRVAVNGMRLLMACALATRAGA
jgi:hypothetical protein